MYKPKEHLNQELHDKNSPKEKTGLYKSEIAESISNQEEKEEEKEKIYGLYPGSLLTKETIEGIKNRNEVELYHAIDGIGGFIWRMNHDLSHYRIPEDQISAVNNDLFEAQYEIEYLVYQTKKFGVEFEEPKKGEHIKPSESYRARFKFYDNHFKKVLTDEQRNTYQKALKNNQDVSEFMPKGNWRDSLKKSEG